MFPNRLTNQKFETAREVSGFYRYFIHQGWQVLINSDNNRFRGIKLISDQYLLIRQKIQSFVQLDELLAYINSHQLQVLNVPMVHHDDRRRNPTFYHELKLIDVYESDINHIFRFDIDHEEPIAGLGWEGLFRINIPYNPLRYDERSINRALASFGIYTFDYSYGNNEEGRFVEGTFAILAADFKLDIDEGLWVQRNADADELDDELISDRIHEIEEGWLDDEDPRI